MNDNMKTLKNAMYGFIICGFLTSINSPVLVNEKSRLLKRTGIKKNISKIIFIGVTLSLIQNFKKTNFIVLYDFNKAGKPRMKFVLKSVSLDYIMLSFLEAFYRLNFEQNSDLITNFLTNLFPQHESLHVKF